MCDIFCNCERTSICVDIRKHMLDNITRFCSICVYILGILSHTLYYAIRTLLPSTNASHYFIGSCDVVSHTVSILIFAFRCATMPVYYLIMSTITKSKRTKRKTNPSRMSVNLNPQQLALLFDNHCG